jgi:hypothetical protein
MLHVIKQYKSLFLAGVRNEIDVRAAASIEGNKDIIDTPREALDALR